MNDFIRVATSLFQVIKNIPVTKIESNEILHYIQSIGNCPRALTSDFELVNIQKLISKQPQIPTILKQWSIVFTKPSSPTKAQAIEFFRIILSAIESMEKILDYEFLAGVTTAQAGHWNDLNTYQPLPKQGWTLHFTSSGAGHYDCLRNQVETIPGDFILLSPSAFFNYQRSRQSEQWVHHWVVFPIKSEWLELLQWSEVGAGIYHTRVDKDSERLQLIGLFEEVQHLSAFNTPFANRLRINLTEQILIRCFDNHSTHNPTVVDDRILKAIRYLEDNYSFEISIENIAQHIHLSNSQLTKLFRQFTGVTPIKWLTEKRMAQASRELTHSLDPINIIADRVGYQDPLYFTRCFHKQFNCSPRDYRKRYLNGL